MQDIDSVLKLPSTCHGEGPTTTYPQALHVLHQNVESGGSEPVTLRGIHATHPSKF